MPYTVNTTLFLSYKTSHILVQSHQHKAISISPLHVKTEMHTGFTYTFTVRFIVLQSDTFRPTPYSLRLVIMDPFAITVDIISHHQHYF